MVRRRIAEQPTSRLAIWARRIALFSLAAMIIGIIVVRSGTLEIVPALATLAGALVLAAVAILLAFGAGLIGIALVAYPAYLGAKAYRLPAIYDVTTDPIDPPRFEAIAKLRPRDANPVTYAGLYAAQQQRAAYSDIEPAVTDSSPQQAYDAVLKIITKRKWHIVDARPPGAGSREGHVEAIARTPILGFREDVVVRVRPAPDGARIDFRSASRYGHHDLGGNAARVRSLIEDVDDVLASPAPEKPDKQEKAEKPEKKPPPKSTQASGKGNSVKR
jgi:uncharacterized protein (DUF1499 family)